MVAIRVNDRSRDMPPHVLVLHVYVLSVIVSPSTSIDTVLHMPSSMAALT